MLRSEQLLALDEDAVRLAAVGLVRLAVQEGTGGVARASAFAESWLALGDPVADGLRVPAVPVLRALLQWTAELLLEVHRGDGPEVLERLGWRSAEAAEEARWAGTAHPAEPTALALVWHAVQALAVDRGPDHRRRIAERCEAYVRDQHRRSDTVALLLALARLAAGAVRELGDGDGALAARVARAMAPGRPAPLWVPTRPQPPAA
ncbi:hypothetical protein ACFW1A_40400 [Kitasatospora sp. NPDC058965]|uniref:hypothetical protein n=1 Tax=Kitasatospora sp. NPDC058965 TaxID=3346682 RepID=UPI0036B66220